MNWAGRSDGSEARASWVLVMARYPQRARVPACAGMTERGAGVTEEGAQEWRQRGEGELGAGRGEIAAASAGSCLRRNDGRWGAARVISVDMP